MSGRFVRASKYRHVFGTPAKPDKQYLSVKAPGSGDSNFLKANTKFIAYIAVGGGGPIGLRRKEDFGRMDAATINVHKAAVQDLDFSPFAENIIATGADDGTVRVTVFPEQGLAPKEVFDNASASLDGHAKKISLVHFHPTASNILGTSSYDNTVRVWDVEKQTQLYSLDFPEIPQSFEWNVDGSMIGVACKDKTVRIYDPRQNGSVQVTTGLPGTKGSRLVWLDNHSKILIAGSGRNGERQYMVLDPKNFDQNLGVTDIDQSAGTMMCFYDPDISVLYMGGKGDSGIKYFEVSSDGPFLHFLSEYRDNQSQKGLAFAPKRVCDTKTCEIAVAYRFMSDAIVPVSLQVPRKSDMFQEDIYPDTFAPIPALSASEWAAGENKAPVTMSMRPGDNANNNASAQKFEMKVTKSAAQLEKELAESQAQLAAANAKIHELEAELAKLKA